MRVFLTCVLVFLCAVCLKPFQAEAGEPAVVEGEITYRERIALPEGSEILAQLVQVDNHGRTLLVLAEDLEPISASVPVPFRLRYDADRVHDSAQYAIIARILHQGKTLFATAEPARLNLPATGKQEIILMQPEDISDLATSPAPRELTGQMWELRTLYGVPVERFEGGQLPRFSVLPDEKRINGYDGCNTFSAGYTHEEALLRFDQGAATLRMCFNGMEQAQALLTALQEANNWRLDANRLELRRFDRVLAVFEGVAL